MEQYIYIYLNVNRDINLVNHANYIIHIIHEYQFCNTLLLNYDFDHENNSGIIAFCDFVKNG